VAYLLGAGGFVGTAVADALRARGVEVRGIAAPRLTTRARDLAGLRAELETPRLQAELTRLRDQLADADVVINAAGLARATSGGDALFGADALLPGLVAAAVPDRARLVHVSSAAVQGRREVLDESLDHEPFSPYSQAKALGELMVVPRGTCFRPTSVQGPGRAVTQTLVRVCSSPLASVGGSGNRPTPQVHVANVGEAIVFTACSPEAPQVVLQPWEGLTTASLVRELGGREPRHVPRLLASGLIRAGYAVGSRSARVAGLTRRMEMLWFGQEQAPGWLDGRWTAPLPRDRWKDLAR
jgi:nucleoside-diphosphate-sugar epimerase